jgi:DNA repair exonuclease SbcCD ATPase subunit
MRRIAAPFLLAFACALAPAGCRRAGGGAPEQAPGSRDAGEVIGALEKFTKELEARVESARDTKAGLADAQKLLDERKNDLAASVAALRASPELKSDAAARGRLLEAEVDDAERVHKLQVKYAEDSTRDPELKERLDRLVSDYDSIFK